MRDETVAAFEAMERDDWRSMPSSPLADFHMTETSRRPRGSVLIVPTRPPRDDRPSVGRFDRIRRALARAVARSSS